MELFCFLFTDLKRKNMYKGNLPLSQESRQVASELEGLWDENAEKYKCCCRTVHVKKASLFIGYAQMCITVFAVLFVLFYYLQVLLILLPLRITPFFVFPKLMMLF